MSHEAAMEADGGDPMEPRRSGEAVRRWRRLLRRKDESKSTKLFTQKDARRKAAIVKKLLRLFERTSVAWHMVSFDGIKNTILVILVGLHFAFIELTGHFWIRSSLVANTCARFLHTCPACRDNSAEMSDGAEEVSEDVQSVPLLQFDLLQSLEKSTRSGNGQMIGNACWRSVKYVWSF